MQYGTSTLIPPNFRYCPPSSKLRAASRTHSHVSITTYSIVSNNHLGQLMPTKSDNPDALASFRIVGNPEVMPPIFRNQVLAPLPRLAPASQINFSGLPLNITAGLHVIRARSGEASLAPRAARRFYAMADLPLRARRCIALQLPTTSKSA